MSGLRMKNKRNKENMHVTFAGYIKHRYEREEQILAALSQNTNESMSTLEIVRIVYEVI